MIRQSPFSTLQGLLGCKKSTATWHWLKNVFEKILLGLELRVIISKVTIDHGGVIHDKFAADLARDVVCLDGGIPVLVPIVCLRHFMTSAQVTAEVGPCVKDVATDVAEVAAVPLHPLVIGLQVPGTSTFSDHSEGGCG